MDLESILSTIQPFLIMLAALFAAFLTATWISVVIWTFRDIRARSRDIFAQILGTLMVLVFFPLFPLPGLAIYFILRPRETLAEIYERSLEEEALLQGIEERLACPGCNRRIEEEFVICPTCHTRLKKACPACGRLLHLRWNICPYCGAVQTAAKAIPSPVQPFSIAVEGPAEAPRISAGRRSAPLGPVDEAESDSYADIQKTAEEAVFGPFAEAQEMAEEAEYGPYAETQEMAEETESGPYAETQEMPEAESGPYAKTQEVADEAESESYAETQEPAEEAESEPYAETQEPAEEAGSEPYAETQEPAEEAESEPYAETQEPAGAAESEPYAETDGPMDGPDAEMQEPPGELGESEENEEAPSSEPNSRWETGTLPFDFE